MKCILQSVLFCIIVSAFFGLKYGNLTCMFHRLTLIPLT